MRWLNADYDMAYTYARGYYDGRVIGSCETDMDWMQAAEIEAYNIGYDRGVSDYHSYDEKREA